MFTILSQLCYNVYKAVDANQNVIVLKMIPMDATGVTLDAVREITFLKLLAHPSIINLLDSTTVDNHIVLVFPLADYTLKEYNLNYTFDIHCLFKQLVTAVNYCHLHYVIHRDIKPDNILIINHHIKLADFGLATFDFFSELKSKDVVTLWYRAPELLLGLPYTSKIDVWSLGCIYYELLYKKVLFKGKDNHHQLNLIYNTPKFDHLLGKMLKLSEARLSSTNLLQLLGA